jgi:hypothetical protein
MGSSGSGLRLSSSSTTTTTGSIVAGLTFFVLAGIGVFFATSSVGFTGGAGAGGSGTIGKYPRASTSTWSTCMFLNSSDS